MPLKVVAIKFVEPAVPFDIASELLSYVAYPLDEQKRTRFAGALCRAEHLRRAHRDPRWGRTPQLVKPRVFELDEKSFSRDLSRGTDTLRRHLMTATLILMPHIKSFITKTAPPNTIDGSAPTVDNIIQYIKRYEKLNEFDSLSTFESQVWDATRPVAHLAFSFAHKIFIKRWKDAVGQGKTQWEILDPYPDEGTLREILQSAELLRLILPELKQVRFSEDETIQFIQGA